MKVESFNNRLDFEGDRIVTQVIVESSFSKEIRMLLKRGQTMKEHQAPFPILIHILEGTIEFGVHGAIHPLQKGAIITLEGKIPHSLTALEDSVVRLTLSKLDHAERIDKVVEDASKSPA